MRQYQYLAKNKADQEEEFWVCESCRKLNNNLILEGKWRLIDRHENGNRVCSECLKAE